MKTITRGDAGDEPTVNGVEQANLKDTLDSLLRLWKEISGVDGLERSSVVDRFADSLMMVQLCFDVKRELGKNIGVDAFKECRTIGDQAAVVLDYPTQSASIQNTSQEPPTETDMPHTRGDREAYEKAKELISKQLQETGLTWDDVEEVYPLPDCEAMMCNRIRSCSWNLRFAYHSCVSPERLEGAVKQALFLHSPMRSTAVKVDRQMLLVTMRLSESWLKASVTSGWELETRDDLKTLHLDDPVMDAATAPGPLARFHVAGLKDGTSGVVVVFSHAIADATSMKVWMSDIIANLTGSVLVPHAPYKNYATSFYHYRDGAQAKEGLKYWSEKLQGVGLFPETTYWPPQRAPEWFKGDDRGWCHWDGTPPRAGERTFASSSDMRRAQQGLVGVAPVQDVLQLKSQHNIPVYMLVKAAIALMNITRTSGKEAIFCTLNAGRTWPFKCDYSPAEQERYVKTNPLDMPGCTFEMLLNRIPVSLSKSVVEFMQQVTKEEKQDNGYAHTPMFSIIDRLRDPVNADDTRTFVERRRDAESILPLLRRQLFNWLGTAPLRHTVQPELVLVENVTRLDNGLSYFGTLCPDRKSIALKMIWDAEHLALAEAESAHKVLMGLIGKMGQEKNWELSIRELMCL